jgi:glycosyltransferase involved in cell wall biosynthesis
MSMERAPHLLHVFPTFDQGGPPLRISTIMNELGPEYRHTVIALDGGFASRRRIQPHVPAAYLDPSIDKRRPLKGFLDILATLRRIRPDLLLTYNWGAIEWAAANRLCPVAPNIHFESGFGPEEAHDQIRRRVCARRFALRRAQKIVVPSQSLVRIATEIWRLDKRRVAYVPNGVDCVLYASPPDPSLVPGIDRAAGRVVVGTVTPLRGEKNLFRMVRAFAEVGAQRNAFLLIVGDGSERAALERLAAELGIADRALFAGHVDRPERVFGLMDVFAMSSDTEQMPNALTQAMAAGRPVVATDVGDVRDMVAEENRPFVTKLGDEPAYAAALARLIEDAPLRATLGAANRRRANEVYPLPRMFAAYRALYTEACAA